MCDVAPTREPSLTNHLKAAGLEERSPTQRIPERAGTRAPPPGVAMKAAQSSVPPGFRNVLVNYCQAAEPQRAPSLFQDGELVLRMV